MSKKNVNTKNEMRLDKFLSTQNISSRKETQKLIRKNRITLDGEIVKGSDVKINPEKNIVCLDGQRIEYRKYVYIMMNKPEGVITASEDKRENTVLDLLPKHMQRRNLFPAGRLDRDTTGLLIITDDGDFAHKMLSPKSHVFKLYRVESLLPIIDDDILTFSKGVTSGNDKFAPAELIRIESEKKNLSMVMIREGKFHQVKRMYEEIGNKVEKLERIKIGSLELDNKLERGESRYLTSEEVEKIFN